MFLQLLRRSPPQTPQKKAYPALRPTDPLCVVGDIHGRADLLELLLARHAASFSHMRLVFLGDMMDRGPDSLAVLTRLHALHKKGAICIAGNHEEMFLSFMAQPENGAHWLRHGGAETIESLGHRLRGGDRAVLCALRNAVRAQLPNGLLEWLAALPTLWKSGNLVMSHAGMDPDRAWDQQTKHDLLWGHPNFGTRPRMDGLWVASGHIVQARPFAGDGRIALDTGAYMTGRLSFALIEPRNGAAAEVTLAEIRQ